MIKLAPPIGKSDIKKLRVGSEVLINGVMVTARDMAHKLMVEEKPDFIRKYLKDGLIYHCGPVVKKEGDSWSFVAAGPTTSKREEPYQGKVIEEYGVGGVIGKGGMGDRTLEALQKHGAVYLHAIGGVGTLLAQCTKRVIEVFKLEEFGSPEAFWVIEVEDFPAIVTMDSYGKSLHIDIFERSRNSAEKILKEV